MPESPKFEELVGPIKLVQSRGQFDNDNSFVNLVVKRVKSWKEL